MKMTPFKLEILIWYHCRGTDSPDIDSPAGQEAVAEFCTLGLLRDSGNGTSFKANEEALNAYIAEVLKVPMPRQVWVCKNSF